jgi:hypothetical protein
MAIERFTYTGDPANNSRDAVRFHAGDTDRRAAEIDDREIDYALTLTDDTRVAAAILLEALASKYSRKADVTAGQVSKRMSTIAGSLREQAAELRSIAGIVATPFFGGLTHSGKLDLDQRTDDVQPAFKRGQFDNPRADSFDGSTDSGEE